MLTFKITDYAGCLNIGRARTGMLLSAAEVPFYVPTSHQARRYDFVSAVPTLQKKYRKFAPDFLALCSNEDPESLWVGQSVKTGTALCSWIEADPVMSLRLRYCRSAFMTGLATMQTGAFYVDMEALRLLLPMATPIITYILTGRKESLPDFKSWSSAFAIVHATSGFDVDHNIKLAA